MPGLSYQHFDFDQYNNGLFHGRQVQQHIALNLVVSRNSVSDPIFPVWGSEGPTKREGDPALQPVPVRPEWAALDDQERFRFVEYHKWDSWPTGTRRSPAAGKPEILHPAHPYFGSGISQYSRQIGLSPFERFYLGGVFLSGFVLDGREIISLRGMTTSP